MFIEKWKNKVSYFFFINCLFYKLTKILIKICDHCFKINVGTISVCLTEIARKLNKTQT